MVNDFLEIASGTFVHHQSSGHHHQFQLSITVLTTTIDSLTGLHLPLHSTLLTSVLTRTTICHLHLSTGLTLHYQFIFEMFLSGKVQSVVGVSYDQSKCRMLHNNICNFCDKPDKTKYSSWKPSNKSTPTIYEHSNIPYLSVAKNA